MKTSTLKKILCVVLCLILATMTACSSANISGEESPTSASTTEKSEFVQPVYTQEASAVEKKETVYVSLDPSGAVTSTIVTDWLHTDTPQVKVNDISSLTGISNLKSEIQPVINGTDITWNMDTTDLYYSGTTSKTPDVSFKITYTLDGNEIAPKDLAGKSGHLKISIDVENNGVKTVDLNGKQVSIYSPVVVVGGFILPEDCFSATSIDGGQLIGDGTKQIAVLAGLPGIKESLGLTDDDLSALSMDFPETYSVEADVTNFALGNMLFSVIPLHSLSLDLGLSVSLDDVKAALEIVDNIRSTFIKLNANELIDIFANEPGKITELSNMLTKTIDLYNSNKALIDVFMDFLTPENIANLQKLITDLEGVDLNELIELMNNPVFKLFFENLPTIAADLEAVMPAINQLNEGLQSEEAQAALKNLPDTVSKLSEIKTTVESNKDIINMITELLGNENIDDLSDELLVISDIINNNDLGIDLDKILENSDELVARVDAWLNMADDDCIFTEATDAMQTSVMYIYETSPISAA